MQMKWNLNIIWLNPVILFCLFEILMKRYAKIWFRIVFFVTGIFIILQLILPQAFNLAFFPLMIILLVRSSVRTGFEWNPLSIKWNSDL
jgi:hypothetical protein